MAAQHISISDILTHGGRPGGPEGRQVNMPIELGSTVTFDTLAAFEAARDARYDSGTRYYGRYGNSAVHALEDVVCALDNADGAVLTSSGVAAITTALMAFAGAGSHLLVADNVYGNTRTFCDGLLTAMGVAVEYFDPMDPVGLATLLRPNTAAIYFEAVGSGTFEVADMRAISAVARAAGLPSICDTTWPTPVFCQPLSLGVDIAVYSASKYLSGHSDAMLGVTVARAPHVQRLRKAVMQIGDKPGAQEVSLVLRGLRTLGIRMETFDRAGRDMAHWLAEQPQIARVLHPARPDCPGHETWLRDYSGAASLFGAVLRPCSPAAMRGFVDALGRFGIGVSWGGFESLVLPMEPVRTARPLALEGPLIRFSIGLEDTGLLKADVEAALTRLGIGD